MICSTGLVDIAALKKICFSLLQQKTRPKSLIGFLPEQFLETDDIRIQVDTAKAEI